MTLGAAAVVLVVSLTDTRWSYALPQQTNARQPTKAETFQALMDAADANDAAGVRRLIDEGVDINGHDAQSGDTPLARAAIRNSVAVIGVLVAAGADVNANSGKRLGTAMSAAIFFGKQYENVEAIEALIRAGAKTVVWSEDTAAKVRLGVPMLVLAASVDRAGVVRALVEAGADVDAGLTVEGTGADDLLKQVGNDSAGIGSTAMMAAAAEGSVASTRALLLAGASVNLRDSRGKTALGYAIEGAKAHLERSKDFLEIRRLLEAAGGIQ